MSRALFDMTWAEHVVDPTATPVATGYSCRSQAARFGPATVDHPIMLL